MTKNYSTTDLDLAATLLAFKKPIKHVVYRGGLAEIQFQDDEEMKSLLEKYRSMNLLVSPQLLFQAKKSLRAQLNDLQANGAL